MDDDRPINVNQYNHEEGKLIASIKWLITRIYEDNGIPDKLRELFYRDEQGDLNLCPAVAAALTNGSLYSQAACKILHDPGLVNQPHGTILRALSHAVELEVRDSDGVLVTEMALIANDPIRIHTHLTLIDALMTAHMKSVITIDRVVRAITEYTTVDKREEPVDCVDAILFWINKICLLVRDDVERSGTILKGNSETEPAIPEMEDLYEDLCDGTCITTLVSFYRPYEVQITDICFNDPNSLQDCRYNLDLLRNFCENYLPWNPLHFEIEDILYLHESLQPNINAFLADLFYFFEPVVNEPASVQLQSPTQRRFVPVNAIPDLRAQNIASRPSHPPRVRRNNVNPNDMNRTYSISSQDSLMTNKSAERQFNRPNVLTTGPTTTFGVMSDHLQSPNGSNGGDRLLDHAKNDSASLTAVRLAMHQRRQEYEQKQYLENSATEAERQKAGKDAFFKLMKNTDQQNRVRANSEMTPQTLAHPVTPGLMDGGGDGLRKESEGGIPTTAREELLSQQVMNLQEQIQSLRLMNQTPSGMSHAISQPSIHNDMMYGPPGNMYQMQRQSVPDPQMYAMPYGYPPTPQRMYEQQSNYAMPHQVPPTSQPPYYSQMRYNQPLPNAGMSFSMYEQQQPPRAYGQQQSFDDYGQPSIPNANTFHLHQANAANSRLDPPLELNRTLTNWGLTYRAPTNGSKKTWAAFNSEHDLRSQPEDVMPHSVKMSIPAGHQDPPKDPDSNSFTTPIRRVKQEVVSPLNNGDMAHNSFSTPVRRPPNHDLSSPMSNGDKSPTGFEIKAEGVSSVMTPEMRAKRDALYTNLMKRKEQIAEKVEEKEAKDMERRQSEMMKQELSEQRKLEKEIRRQKLLDEYKRKKLEKEFPDLLTPTQSARSTSSLQRGHSQPPLVAMAKTQSSMSDVRSRTMQRSSRAKSNAADENLTPRIPSTAEPSLKLFAKHVPKSNRALIVNALQFSIFPGAVSSDQRNKVQEALAQSDSKHFLLLFRDQKCQYRGLYTWDSQSDTVHRVHGMGPKIVKEDMMSMMYKYDSGSKKFSGIPSKHLSPTIDGFTIQDQLWQKPKIPYSGTR